MKTYLQGGARPSQASANTIMMALAANAATSACALQPQWLHDTFGR
jgi:hypothetical protein